MPNYDTVTQQVKKLHKTRMEYVQKKIEALDASRKLDSEYSRHYLEKFAEEPKHYLAKEYATSKTIELRATKDTAEMHLLMAEFDIKTWENILDHGLPLSI